jgi:hypothetical protein
MIGTLAFFFFFSPPAPLFAAPAGANALRKIESTSCRAIPVRVGLDMTTQIVFEQEPKTTLYADRKHFKIVTNSSSNRSLAIIPVVEPSELDAFRDSKGRLPSPDALASALDRSFKTNLFVFFDHGNQLTFQLHFVDKNKADQILKVKQIFDGDCVL